MKYRKYLCEGSLPTLLLGPQLPWMQFYVVAQHPELDFPIFEELSETVDRELGGRVLLVEQIYPSPKRQRTLRPERLRRNQRV